MKYFTIFLIILILTLTSCVPTPASQANDAAPATAEQAKQEEPAAPEPAAAATDTPLPAADTDTPQPTATDPPLPSATVQPSAVVQHYDIFVSHISKQNAHVEYSPQVIRKGDKFTATIYLPVETPGAHGLPFSEVYTVVVEVYTQGDAEFEAGQFLGTGLTFSGEDISGSSAEKNMIITWYNPTYSHDMDYVYVFTIYPLSAAFLSGAKMACLVEQGDPLQTITMAGMPDPANQVTFQDWPTPGSLQDPVQPGTERSGTSGSDGQEVGPPPPPPPPGPGP